jgi:hypothetical protein
MIAGSWIEQSVATHDEAKVYDDFPVFFNNRPPQRI